MEIKNEKELAKLLKHWKNLASNNPKGEHYDLTDQSWWIENINYIRSLINQIEEKENVDEIRENLTKLLRRKNSPIWAHKPFLLLSLIKNGSSEDIWKIKEILLEIANSEKFREGWINELYHLIERANPDSTKKFKALRGVIANIVGELFGKLHIEKYPVMNSCSRRFLERFFEFDKYDYNGFTEAFEVLKEQYIGEVGRLSKEIPINVEIDLMFNYFDKDPEGRKIMAEVFKGNKQLRELKEELVQLKGKYYDDWFKVEGEFMDKIEQIRDIVVTKFGQNQKFNESDVEEILKLYKSVPKNCRFILQYIASKGMNQKEVLLKLFNTGQFADLVSALENEELDSVEALYDSIKQNVYNIGHSTLSTWLAILRSDLYMPLWGYVKDPGTLPQNLLKDFKELKKFVQWWDLSTHDLFELLDVLRNAANDAGITNMFEAAFYLSKYESKQEQKHGRRIWLIAPGTGAEYWDVCVERGIICVGWREAAEDLKEALFDINNYKTFKTEMSRFGYKDSAQLWKFLKEMSKGDILLAKKGARKIIGIGVVDSEPEIDLQLDYPIYRKVKWYRANLDIDSPKQFAGTITELTDEDLTKVPELKKIIDKMIGATPEDAEENSKDFEKISRILNSKKQLILYGPPGTGKTWLADKYVRQRVPEKHSIRKKTVEENVRFFWWTINPSRWDYSQLKVGKSVDMWTGRLKRAFEEIQNGDIVFIYVGGNVGAIYGIGFYEEKDGKPHVRVKKIFDDNRVKWNNVKADSILSSSKPVRMSARATLIDMEPHEGIRLIELSGLDLEEFSLREVESYEEVESTRFVTFHPSYSYEEFVEGLRPETSEDGQLTYKVEEGIFKRICRDAFNALMSHMGIDAYWKKGEGLPKLSDGDVEKVKNVLAEYVASPSESNIPEFFLIIDEINRGDISKIFGELITLLEADKRLFMDNELTAILPYSKTKFGVPPNLYIIGTMNTADRSIALIDVALRRRFGFIEMMPDYDVLKKELLDDGVSDEVKDLRKLSIDVLKTINERIKREYDRDHQIGHSYFLKLKECNSRDETFETLKTIWYHEILPLLQEYFYDDPQKLKKVLNERFIDVEDNSYEFIEEEGFIEALKKVAKGE